MSTRRVDFQDGAGFQPDFLARHGRLADGWRRFAPSMGETPTLLSRLKARATTNPVQTS
ncbi:MAG TPA: hypothetical protein VHF69_04525 [Candidatus Synoicihabitans sp.]|nr:hypothetical protein [Candidatus Synoicihabitans sp.]